MPDDDDLVVSDEQSDEFVHYHLPIEIHVAPAPETTTQQDHFDDDLLRLIPQEIV
ncbi:MAG: hypothetical protein AAGF12_22100 [Myxococcota bacterium]